MYVGLHRLRSGVESTWPQRFATDRLVRLSSSSRQARSTTVAQLATAQFATECRRRCCCCALRPFGENAFVVRRLSFDGDFARVPPAASRSWDGVKTAALVFRVLCWLFFFASIEQNREISVWDIVECECARVCSLISRAVRDASGPFMPFFAW